ncbi:MAG: Rieske 2Fe-2S domain-containing protein [Actinomycetota bacterium]|nr:Rieske 2Fe-2S domain-containing protein [Actinomycetota bacterium]
MVGDLPVCVVRDGGQVHALLDRCSHADVALSEGEVADGEIECWLHGSTFDLNSGVPAGPPAIRPVPVFDATTEGDDVLVDLP